MIHKTVKRKISEVVHKGCHGVYSRFFRSTFCFASVLRLGNLPGFTEPVVLLSKAVSYLLRLSKAPGHYRKKSSENFRFQPDPLTFYERNLQGKSLRYKFLRCLHVSDNNHRSCCWLRQEQSCSLYTVGRSERDRRSVFRKSIIFPILCSAKITHSLEGSKSIYQFRSSIVG